MLQLVRRLNFLLALEHAHILAVVQNANNLLILRLHDTDILQHLINLCLAQSDARCLRLQHQRHICLVLR